MNVSVIPVLGWKQATRFNQSTNCSEIPLPGILEFEEAEARLSFTFAGEKLLHQPFFMGFECIHFAALRGDQLVHGVQKLGDSFLLR
ncbi:hypothetical protein BV351_05286 [Pseudomonas syringae pv. actinidiae]|nr:hypothetical protein BV351_05286 [Pseudomonas syringae pv. actinidiae]RMS13822.1 hypothetical protein ALP75_201281 [Pseudomonas syringae pv. actinidiae]